MHVYYTFLALDLARERAAEARAHRLASLGHQSETAGHRARRLIARVAYSIARAADEEIGSVSLTTH